MAGSVPDPVRLAVFLQAVMDWVIDQQIAEERRLAALNAPTTGAVEEAETPRSATTCDPRNCPFTTRGGGVPLSHRTITM